MYAGIQLSANLGVGRARSHSDKAMLARSVDLRSDDRFAERSIDRAQSPPGSWISFTLRTAPHRIREMPLPPTARGGTEPPLWYRVDSRVHPKLGAEPHCARSLEPLLSPSPSSSATWPRPIPRLPPGPCRARRVTAFSGLQALADTDDTNGPVSARDAAASRPCLLLSHSTPAQRQTWTALR